MAAQPVTPSPKPSGQWKDVATHGDAVALIDAGVMLRWRDLRTLRRTLKGAAEEQVMRHFAKRLAERSGQRLAAEILVESLVVYLAHAEEESLLNAFLEELFAQPGLGEAAWCLVEIALTADMVDSHRHDTFEMAVVLVCELGLSIQSYERTYPGDIRNVQALLGHIATYLLSVSNANSACTRLSLVHYFGQTEHGRSQRTFTNRIMSRFGHTVLDHLFALLFRKRSEAVALQYLLENLPFMLGADRFTQKIIFETLKSYMLKEPERFALFVAAFSDELQRNSTDAASADARRNFLHHLAALLMVASDLNHRWLAAEFLGAMRKFSGSPAFREALQILQQEPELRPRFRAMAAELGQGLEAGPELKASAADSPRGGKRGRRPSFARSQGVGVMAQVSYLGGLEMPKAS